MNADQSKIFKLITGIAGLAGSGILIGAGPIIDAAFPGWGVKVLAYLTLASFAASAILQVLGSSPPSGTQWLVAPKVSTGDVAHVAPGTPMPVPLSNAVVDPTTPIPPTVVPPLAPPAQQKGP